jgi:hypothetical protein
VTTKWIVNKENHGSRENTYPYMLVLRTRTSSSVEVSIFIKKIPQYPVNACKLDSMVKNHSEISKNKIFLDFLDMIYAKKITHTTLLCTRNYALVQVNPISRLRLRIFFIIDEIMSRHRHHMEHDAGARPLRNGFSNTKILIMSGFVRYKISVMVSIKT